MTLLNSSAAQIRIVIDQSLTSTPTPLAGGGGAAPIGGAPVSFCSVWPPAKPILQALVPIVSAIPGAGKAAAAVLNSLIVVGDSVFQQTCPAVGGGSPTDASAEVRSLLDLSLTPASLAPDTLGGGGSFCTVWPQAKPILQVLSAIVAFIPGVGVAAGPVLTSLIAVGDSVFQQTCRG